MYDKKWKDYSILKKSVLILSAAGLVIILLKEVLR